MQPNRTGLPNTAALGQAVDEGGLWIDGLLVADGAPERCAQRYERLADAVEAQLLALGATEVIPGFGGLPSGTALRTGFEDKAADALTQLRTYASTARELAAVFRAAGAAYQEGDRALSDAVAQLQVPGDGHA
ncbi:hypothetical protein [Nocardia neocaledoniensis]|uniref:hypothetical protein n=1 Tax=Nocardia neocaledoniensis TaxID=236511 RepID=UPI0024542DC0|nr:hypothetical protein [Nocardia neocaledoniensis]